MSEIPSAAMTATLFEGLTCEERRLLLHASTVQLAAKGEVIHREGEPRRFLGIVAHGYVRLTRRARYGKTAVVDVVGPDGAFGILAAIQECPYLLTASAIERTEYIAIPISSFARAYAKSSTLKSRVAMLASQHLGRAYSLISLLSWDRVEQRLAALLLSLASSCGEPEALGVRIAVPLTRSELARLARTTVETTIRTLSEWQKEHIVSTARKRIRIDDRARLERIVCEESAEWG